MSKIDEIDSVDPAALKAFDAIIDVRSPAEFAEDHIPGAINLPALDDLERAEVGKIYTKVSKFNARRIGAAYIAQNAARHLTEFFADKPGSFRPLLYCWRGGMRSGAMATIYSQVGWRTSVLKGGYRTWRRAVVSGLCLEGALYNLILLDGQTGTAKSALLEKLNNLGVQVIDLERLAAHRGSVFGSLSDRPQPSQKMFESELWFDLQRINNTSPVIVEAESNRIGQRQIPKRFWNSMQSAPRIYVQAGIENRADYIVEAYRDFVADRNAVVRAVESLNRFHTKTEIETWLALAAAQDDRTLAFGLIQAHYDPLYERSRKKRNNKVLAELQLNGFTAHDFDIAALQLKEIIASYDNALAPNIMLLRRYDRADRA